MTLAILLGALRDRAAEMHEPALTDGLQNVYLSHPFRSGSERHKVLPSSGDASIFHQIVSGAESPISDHVLTQAYRFFSRRLQITVREAADGERLLQAALHGLEVMVLKGEYERLASYYASMTTTGMPRYKSVDLVPEDPT